MKVEDVVAGRPRAGGTGDGQAADVLADVDDPGMAAGQLGGHLRGLVGGAAVDDHDLAARGERPVGDERLDAVAQLRGAVLAADDHAQRRAGGLTADA